MSTRTRIMLGVSASLMAIGVALITYSKVKEDEKVVRDYFFDNYVVPDINSPEYHRYVFTKIVEAQTRKPEIIITVDDKPIE